MSVVPPGRRECKLSKRARERARMEQTEKKEEVGEFYATKEKQVLLDEGIMEEKRQKN